MAIKYKKEKWMHINVNPNGVIDKGGAVHTSRGARIFRGTPCDCGTCKGAHDFIAVCEGYNAKKRTVSGYTLYFKNTKDLNEYIDEVATNALALI